MQRYFVNKKEDNKFILDISQTHHIVNVMRLNILDKIEIVYDGFVYLTKIIEINKNVVVEIIEKLDIYNELDIKVTLCQGLVKENKMDFILQKGVELGINSFIPINLRNSIIKLNDKDKEKKVLRWQKIVYEASRQSKRNIIPKVNNVLNLVDIINLNYDLKLLCTVNTMSINIKNVLQKHKNCDNMIIVVGPEGGFKKEEEEMLIKHGFISVSLGNLVLRTETASVVLMSMINYEYMR